LLSSENNQPKPNHPIKKFKDTKARNEWIKAFTQCHELGDYKADIQRAAAKLLHEYDEREDMTDLNFPQAEAEILLVEDPSYKPKPTKSYEKRPIDEEQPMLEGPDETLKDELPESSQASGGGVTNGLSGTTGNQATTDASSDTPLEENWNSWKDELGPNFLTTYGFWQQSQSLKSAVLFVGIASGCCQGWNQSVISSTGAFPELLENRILTSIYSGVYGE
jgi:hypothetical protein